MDNTGKNAYHDKMEAQLTKLKAEIQRLEGELNEKKADARLGMHDDVQRLRERRDKVEAKLDELKSASGDAWSEAKQGLASAWTELEDAFQKASAQFKRK